MTRCPRCFAPVFGGVAHHEVCPLGPRFPDPVWDGVSPLELYADADGDPMTMRQFLWASGDESYRRVGDTTCDDGWRVSTIWLGVKFLRVFETMLFDADGGSVAVWGCGSRAEAVMMHEVVVALAQDATRRDVYLGERDAVEDR